MQQQPAPLNGNQKAGLAFIGLLVVALMANELLDSWARWFFLGLCLVGVLIFVIDGADAW
jgi:hypothetical protein